jgi:beta-glucanase (GH16 family)
MVYDNNVKYHYPKELLSETYNKYTIVWFPDYYEWRFNDLILRRLNKNDTDIFPDAPSNIKFSIWEAGPSIWAGTTGIQWNESPFEYYISFVQLRCPDAFISNNSIFYDDRNINKMKSSGSANKISIILLLINLLISV